MKPASTTIEFGDVKVTCSPLGYFKSEDILAEVMAIVSHVMRDGAHLVRQLKLTPDSPVNLIKLAPALALIADELGDGRLKRLAPLVMAATQVNLVVDGQRQVCDLVKSTDRETVFDEHPELYFPILFIAGRVTFARFFSVKDLFTKIVRKE